MQVKLNMKNVGNLYTAVPNDVYRVRITAWEDKEADSGPYGKATLTICEGEFAETRAIDDAWFFSEKSLWRTKQKLEAFTNQAWDEDDMDFDSDELLQLEAYVQTEQEAFTRQDGTEGVKSKAIAFYSCEEMEAPSSPADL